jgi:hypothetical protein
MFSDFEVPLHEIRAAFLLSGTFMTSGVAFELSDGQIAYFWTLRDHDRVLAVLQQRGVLIDRAPRRATRSLSGQLGLGSGRSTPSVVRLPGLSRPMTVLRPFFMVAGIAVIVIFASRGTPFGWFVAAVGTVGLVRSVLAWRRSRNS